MKSKFLFLPLILLLGVFTAPANAEETLRDGARSAGRAVGSAIRDVGQGAKEAGKEVVKGAKSAGGAAREGGREFRKAVKGEK